MVLNRIDNSPVVITEHDPSDINAALRGCARMRTLILTLAVLILFSNRLTSAQQTVFNVPTADVLDRGKVYFELDVSLRPNDSTAVDKFSSFVPRLVIGAGHHIETGVNVLGNIQPGPDSTTISPTIKWTVYDGADNGWPLCLATTCSFQCATAPTIWALIPMQ